MKIAFPAGPSGILRSNPSAGYGTSASLFWSAIASLRYRFRSTLPVPVGCRFCAKGHRPATAGISCIQVCSQVRLFPFRHSALVWPVMLVANYPRRFWGFVVVTSIKEGAQGDKTKGVYLDDYS